MYIHSFIYFDDIFRKLISPSGLITRMKEHNGKSKPVRRRFEACECEFTMNDVEIIKSTSKSMYHLMTLETLLIRSIKPNINTRDEYKRITLSLKI